MMYRLQNWILKRKFIVTAFEVAKEEIYRKAFKDARADLDETNVYDIDKKAEELSNSKINSLLSVVDVNKIVTLDKTRGIVYIGGSKVDEGRLSNLKAEAEFFLESDLWHLIYETPKELAQRSMFVNGETLADMAKGKSMLYTLSTQNNIVQTFKGYVPKPKIVQPPPPMP